MSDLSDVDRRAPQNSIMYLYYYFSYSENECYADDTSPMSATNLIVKMSKVIRVFLVCNQLIKKKVIKVTDSLRFALL